jgi:hypothetical protein
MEWNREDWQGRTEKQVRDTEKTMTVLYTAFFILVASYLLYLAF